MNVFVDANIFIRIATQGRPGCEREHLDDLRTLVEEDTFVLLVPDSKCPRLSALCRRKWSPIATN